MSGLFDGIICSFVAIFFLGILFSIKSKKKTIASSKTLKNDMLQLLKYWVLAILLVIFILLIATKK